MSFRSHLRFLVTAISAISLMTISSAWVPGAEVHGLRVGAQVAHSQSETGLTELEGVGVYTGVDIVPKFPFYPTHYPAPNTPVELDGVAVQDSPRMAYVTSNCKLHTVDMADPSRPRAVSAVPLPRCSDLYVSRPFGPVRHDRLLISGEHSVSVVDVSDPSRPRARAILMTRYGFVKDVAFRYPYVFAISWDDRYTSIGPLPNAELELFDLTAPEPATAIWSFASNVASAIRLQNGRAVLWSPLPSVSLGRGGNTPGESYLRVFDISNLPAVKPVATFFYPYDLGWDFWLGDDVAVAIRDGGRIAAIDLADPAQPKWSGETRLHTACRELESDYFYAAGVAMNDTFTLAGGCPGAADGLARSFFGTVQFTGAKMTGWLGRVDQPAWDAFPTGPVDGDSGQVLVPTASGLQVVDVGDPARPQRAGNFLPVDHRSLNVDGSTALVADGANGLEIVDVRMPDRAKRIQVLPLEGIAQQVASNGELAVVGTDDGRLHLVDVLRPGQARWIRSVQLGGSVQQLNWSGDTLFVADGHAGLRIVRVGCQNELTVLGSVDTPGYARAIALEGSRAFVADWNGGIQIVDVSDLQRPRLVGNRSVPGIVTSVAAFDHTLFATVSPGDPRTSAPSKLIAFDTLSVPPMTQLGALDLCCGAWNVRLDGRRAFVAAGSDIYMVDVSNPSAMKVAADRSYQAFSAAAKWTEIYTWDMVAAHGLAFTASTGGGMSIWRYGLPTPSATALPSSPVAPARFRSYLPYAGRGASYATCPQP